jgi:putative membrane protein
MNVFAQVFAGVAGLVHVLIFALESVRFPRDPKVQANFRVAPEDVNAVRPWAFNQGFYNLFLAIGIFLGLVRIWAGDDAAGVALVGFACACMVGAAAVLVGTDRRMLRGALVQGVAPLLALVAIAVGG